jgi:RNA polymerase sigma-70 factor, ECF subfamily
VETRPSHSLSEDRQRFDAFVREHEAVLRATALRLCRDASDARDLVQDTFERALRNFHTWRPGTDGRAWLMRILHNLFIDRCRAQATQRRADVSAEELEERIAAPEPEAAPAWASLGVEEVRAALGQLNEDFRIVYQLHAIEGRSYNEISERLHIPKATVGTRLIRARRRLKQFLMPDSVEAEG